MKKIYIAGFDVFKGNSIEIGRKYKELCSDYGFQGLYPLDNELSVSNCKEPKEIARKIYLGNISCIEQADIVIANLNPFRGFEPDSGTVFECGYALGLNKKVLGYIEDCRDLIDRIPSKKTMGSDGVQYLDEKGMTVENFNLPLNLMLGSSIDIYDSFESCLRAIASKQ